MKRKCVMILGIGVLVIMALWAMEVLIARSARGPDLPPLMITNLTGTMEPTEMHLGDVFYSWTLRSIWTTTDPDDQTRTPESARFISIGKPMATGTFVGLGEPFEYLFVVDEDFRDFLPALNTQRQEPYTFYVLNARIALGPRGVTLGREIREPHVTGRSVADDIFDYISLCGMRVTFDIREMHIQADASKPNSIAGFIFNLWHINNEDAVQYMFREDILTLPQNARWISE